MKEEEERLNCDAVELKPVHYDFSKGYAEAWEYFKASECEKCGKAVVLTGQDHHNEIEKTECDGYLNGDGPMMNYYYPLPGFKMDPQEAAKLIVDLPLCIVYFTEEEEYALALTGGGMDLSWEICAAYMKVGYWPPTHFRLPGMAGGPGIGIKEAKRVVKGMKESIKISQNWQDSNMADVKRAEERIKEIEKDRKQQKKKK